MLKGIILKALCPHCGLCGQGSACSTACSSPAVRQITLKLSLSTLSMQVAAA